MRSSLEVDDEDCRCGNYANGIVFVCVMIRAERKPTSMARCVGNTRVIDISCLHIGNAPAEQQARCGSQKQPRRLTESLSLRPLREA